MDFLELFDTLDAKTRAALVFRYREELPLPHVAQLVDEDTELLEQRLGRALAQLRDCGALSAAATEEELCQWLEKLRDEPALSAFSLVLAVRSQPRRRRFARRAG